AGEEAALAAFRTASAARATAAAASAAPADLGRVRLAPAPGPGRRWGRSLRYGLAAALAAVTVGGVAVAAGTGVLPLVDKEPSRTVTAAETATPPDPSEPTAGLEGHDDPSRSADPGRPSGTPAPGTSPTARPQDGTTSPRPGTTPTGEDRTERDPADPTATARGGDTGEARIAACRDYRSGRLDEAGRRRLSTALRTGETLRVYCDRILGGGADDSASTGSTGSGGSGSGSGADAGDKEKDGDAKDDDAKEEDGNAPDLSHGTVPTPSDPSRRRGQDRPDPKDRPKAKPRAKADTRDETQADVQADTQAETQSDAQARTRAESRTGAMAGAPVEALALCPAGAPDTGV
ncbi:hypothetical protein, partial [Streptomyces sp. NPDC059762]